MNQDYSNLYGASKPTTVPPPQTPSPYNHSIPGQPDAPPPKPFVLQGSDVPPSAPPQMTAAPQRPQAAPPVPPKPRQPFSPIPLLMIAGVAFLFLGGVIFLTNTWDSLPDMARAVALLSVGVISFGIHSVAGRLLKLPKTGLAFYILGCIFLPMAVAGIGAFSLFGEWFSFSGDGSRLVGAATAACVALSTFVGVRNYKHPMLAWMSLAAAAVTWGFLSAFVGTGFALHSDGRVGITGGMYLLLCIGASVWSEWKLRTAPETPWGKAALWFLFPLLFVTASAFLILAAIDGEAPVAVCILAAVTGALFFNKRMICDTVHVGVIGMVLCLLAMGSAAVQHPAFGESLPLSAGLAVLTAASFVMTGLSALPRSSEVLRKTARGAGMILSIPMILAGGTAALVSTRAGILTLFAALMLLSIVFFISTKRHPLTEDTPLCVLYAVQLFMAAILGTREQTLFAVLLILGAVILLVQAFVRRRLWCFVLAGAACAGMLLLNLEEAFLWIFWLCTGISLAGVILSHVTRRQLLEKCFSWVFLPTLLTSGLMTLERYMEKAPTWTLLLAAVTLLYLLEAVVLSRQERTRGTRLYLEIVSGGIAFGAFAILSWEQMWDKTESAGLGFLTLLSLIVFCVPLVRKRWNLAALPHLLLLFFTARYLIVQITQLRVVSWELPLWGGMEPQTAAELLQAGCYILVLAGFALMGRILLPKFCDTTDGFRLDLPLLMGIFPIIAAAVSIDWYPGMLLCLFLTAYSLLFIGRVQEHYVPALLASLFGCITLLLHNIHDPFGLLDQLKVLDIQSLRTLLYVLPFHLFIFTLLFILPKSAKPGVHIARYVMYVVTMLCLLVNSLNFGNVADAIILVVFSFLILLGSFSVKRLRWFTLGFAVLVVMTIHQTWEFWTSLHWGIYLFLAGIVLIAIASVYEYSVRYAREHPDAPRKKVQLFSTWKW